MGRGLKVLLVFGLMVKALALNMREDASLMARDPGSTPVGSTNFI